MRTSVRSAGTSAGKTVLLFSRLTFRGVWKSVRASVGTSVRTGAWASVGGESVRMSARASRGEAASGCTDRVRCSTQGSALGRGYTDRALRASARHKILLAESVWGK